MTVTTSSKTFDIAIVGGGIAGISLAIGLIRRNVPVTVYESAPEFSEIGAGVGLAPNAVRALELLDPQARAGFEKVATRNIWASKQSTWFDMRWGIDLDDERGSPKEKRRAAKCGGLIGGTEVPGTSTGYGMVHRAHFLDQLVALLPEGVAQFKKKLASLDEGPDGVTLGFEDGTTARHSAVVGCDGIHSATRLHVLGPDSPAAHPVYSGTFAYRGLCGMDEAIEVLGAEQAQNNAMYLGPNGLMLTYPVANGKMVNLVAIGKKETWDANAWVAHPQKEQLQRDFVGWGDVVQKLISLLHSIDMWSLHDLPQIERFYKGSVCVMGDAAHAALPFQGSGAAMAIEDALVMSSLIGAVERPKDIESAFYAFEMVRRERTQRMQSTSRQALYLTDMDSDQVWSNRDKIVKDFNERMVWIWSENLENEVKLGKSILTALPN